MKILLTGSTGFIGKHLYEHLKENHLVLAPGREELDMVDEHAVNRFFQKNPVDIVIHSAGKPGHRNIADPSGVFYDNIRMYFNLVKNDNYFDRLIIIGSGGIYDMRYYQPKMPETFFGRHMPKDKHGFFRYVTGKHIEKSSKILDLRIFGLFGPYEDYAIRFVSNAICKTLFDLPITIKQNRYFDYLYIKDLLPVIDFFLKADMNHTAYNVTPDQSVDLLTIAKMIKKISGKEIPVQIKKDGMGLEYSGSNQRLRKEIPGLKFTDLKVAVAELYDFYVINRNLIDVRFLLVDK